MSFPSSYHEKIDPRLRDVISGILFLYDLFDIGKNAGEALQPEFLAKFKKEGCPDWMYLYVRKIKMRKFFEAVRNEFPVEFKEELKKLDNIKNR